MHDQPGGRGFDRDERRGRKTPAQPQMVAYQNVHRNGVPGYGGDPVAAFGHYLDVLAECCERGQCVACGAFWLPELLGDVWTAVLEHDRDDCPGPCVSSLPPLADEA